MGIQKGANRTARRVSKMQTQTSKTVVNHEENMHPHHAHGLTWSNIILGLMVAILTVSVNHYFILRRATVPINGTMTESSDLYIPRDMFIEHKHFPIRCHRKKKSRDFIPGCHKTGHECGRALRDQFISDEEVVALREIAEIGMKNHSKLGGPTIMDINTGFVKSGDGLVNIYQSHPQDEPIPRFTKAQFTLYRRVIENIRLAVMQEFHLDHLYFTAPTFITRIVGNTSWSATELHDEYWHPHVDKDNTAHYDYSGLLYLSDYNLEFNGGLFAFLPKKKTSKQQSDQIIEPARGRLMMFTSGKENLHQVRLVETGIRYVMSMWFTCDERRHFQTFLDGHMHVHFQE